MQFSSHPVQPILLVDDEPHILTSFDVALRSNGINNIITCEDSRQVMTILREQQVGVLLLDLIMPQISGQEILSRVTEEFPDIPVIVVTSNSEVEAAVDCMHRGAFDYILKPVDINRLLPCVRRAIETSRLRYENSMLSRRFMSDTLEHPEVFSGIITQDRKMHAIFQYCEAVAAGQQPVLITGETGVGKELVAQALHDLSGCSGEFIAVNVAGLDDNVFSDTLFGHARGAFTGADRIRSGLVEKAAGGTLFMDEIGDLSEASQVKLLRFLEERHYYPLGTDVAKSSDARVLVATQSDLEKLQNAEKFRSDLYYRFRTHHVRVPPLRERPGDIKLLFDHFLEEAANEFNREKPNYNLELITLLQGYNFPGNVRELRSMVFDAVCSSTARTLTAKTFNGVIEAEYRAAGNDGEVSYYNNRWAANLDRLPTLKEASQVLVGEALKRTKGNQRVAALMLGITPQALSQRLKKAAEK